MSFWSDHPELICLGSAAISISIAFLLLRPFKQQQLVRRLPLFLVTGGAFLFGAVITLPEVWPHIFERFLGHSLSDMVTRQLSAGVIMSEEWITFWGESVGIVFDLTILASAIWAVVNLFRKTAIWSNVLTLMVSRGWACLYVGQSAVRSPF